MCNLKSSSDGSETILRSPRPTLPGWPAPRNPAYLVHATHGAVAAENKLCSDLGVKILKEGGNAMDASITAVLCTGVVNMFSSGIGGGGFLTIRLPPASANGTSEAWTVDFRETAPAAANSTMFSHNPNSSRIGGLGVGVPGELRGLEAAHKRWGKLPWKSIVSPVAKLSEGWPVGIELSRRIRWDSYEKLMFGVPEWKAVFAPKGRLLAEGETIRRIGYGKTLHAVAEHGAEVFYSGKITEAMLAKIRATGGILTAEDFANYKPIIQPALKGTFKNKTVYTSHAPTSGPALLHMLNLYEKFEAKGDKGLNLHRFVETMKYGFAARTRIADPAFLNDTSMLEAIPTKVYAEKIFRNITDDTTHDPEYYNPVWDIVTDHGTSHTSVVDSTGMAVSVTSTVNLIFGSQVMDPVTGVIFNDELDDFSQPGVSDGFGLRASPFNYPAPHKRPLSSTSPTILEHSDGSVYLVLGGSGGSRIFPSVAQVILGKEAWVDVSKAVEGPRVHNQLYPLPVDVDSTIDNEGIKALKERGHNVTVSDINRVAAVVQAILVSKDGRIFAASDSRKNGIAAGY
ncbi:hypothetical protein M422DRAFT_161129 [Sphaerobolus stellatus SS14]|nr:hypothetical protein M422DRAFT_161129 [Sphaerobolus stellatus SS14]